MRKPGLDICNTQHAVQCDSPALSTGFNVSYISTCGLLFLTCKMPLFLSQSCRGFWHTMLSHKNRCKNLKRGSGSQQEYETLELELEFQIQCHQFNST